MVRAGRPDAAFGCGDRMRAGVANRHAFAVLGLGQVLGNRIGRDGGCCLSH
jgi:hypothetical protein